MCIQILEVWDLGWMSFPCFISSNREALHMRTPFLLRPVNFKLLDGLKKKRNLILHKAKRLIPSTMMKYNPNLFKKEVAKALKA